MDGAFVSQHMLEEKQDSSETNLQSKTSTNGKDVSQFKAYRRRTLTMLCRSKTLLHVSRQ
jgi:hypothetical protein